MTIGQKLRKLRGTRKISEVTEATGIPQPSLSMYENDTQIPSDERKKILSSYYQVPVGYIFFDEEYNENKS